MTSEEIDKLEAGPETDALVAVEVMKWPFHDMSSAFGHVFPNEQHWMYEGRHYWREDGKLLSQLFNPSISILVAWEVLEKFAPGPKYMPSLYQISLWYCNFMIDGQRIESSAPTASLAICRVALKTALPQDSTKSRVKGKMVRAHDSDRDVRQVEAVKTAVALTTSGVGTGFGGHGGGRR